MKRLLCILTLVVMACFSFAAATNYTFSYSPGTYSEITGGTVSTITTDNGGENITLPFGFVFDGVRYFNARICANGWLMFYVGTAPTLEFYTNSINGTTLTKALLPLWDDLYPGLSPTSFVRYEMLNTSPNRTFVVQWTNMLWQQKVGSAQNFQIRLIENTNVIHYVYGAMLTPGGTPTASIGLVDAVGGSGHYLSVTPGVPPTVSSTTANDNINSINYLTSGTTYTFTPAAPTSVPNLATIVSPANEATSVFTSATLNWADGGGWANGFKLYFGTNQPPAFVGNLGYVTTYDPPGNMAINTTYYWKVVPYNGFGDKTTAATWSFTTAGAPLTGTKTIGPGGNYISFTEAITALNGAGIGAGGVTFNVADGTYNESPPAINVSGTAENPIVFQSLGGNTVVTPSGGANTFGFKLNGVNYITFDNIDINAPSTLSWGYWLPGLSGAGSSNNTIKNCSITWPVGTSANYGIYSQGANGAPNSNNYFYNNTISNCNRGFSFSNNQTAGSEAINVRIISNTLYGIRNYGIYFSYHLTSEIKYNNVNFYAGGTTDYYGINVVGPTSTVTVQGNNILSGYTSGTVYAIYNVSGSNNYLDNVISGPYNTSTSAWYGFYAANNDTQWIANTITGITNTGTGAVYAAYFTTGNHVFRNNEIVNIATAGTSLNGIYVAEDGTTHSISNNKIHNLRYTGTGGGIVCGIFIGLATTTNVYNNMVYDLQTPTTTGTAPQLRGIHVAGGTTVNIWNNTVYLNSTSSSAGFSTAALYVSSSLSVFDLKNNIFVNKSVPGSSGKTVAFWKNTTGYGILTSTSDKNIYYAGAANATHLIAYISTTTPVSYITLENYKIGNAGKDQGSYAEDVSFMSSTRIVNLHINPSVATRVEGNAIPIVPPVSIDIDQDPRSTTLPDIGADEGTFTPVSGTPSVPNLSSPTNGATAVALAALLFWSSGSTGGTPTSYQVYFGTAASPPSVSTQTGTSYDPLLAYSTTYYWKIKAINSLGNATSGIYSFTTMADPTVYTFPLSESFEGTTFPPANWLNVKTAGTAGTGTWDRQTAGIYPTCSPSDGSAMARFFSAYWPSGTQGILVTPPLGFTNDQYEVRFMMYRDPGEAGSLEGVRVYYNTAANLTGATLLGTICRDQAMVPVVATNGWYEYAFNMPAGSTGIAYVIIEGFSDSGNNIFIDNVRINQLLAAPPSHVVLVRPTNGSTDVNPYATTLNWNSPVGGGAIHYYKVYVSLFNGDITNNYDYYTEASSNSLNLSALPGVTLGYNTTWYWAVLPVNNAYGSPPVSNPAFQVFSFATANDPAIASLPHTQNFDGVTAPAFPTGWTAYKSYAASIINTSTSYAQSTPSSVYLNNTTTTETMRLISPQIIPAIGTIKLTFYLRAGGPSYNMKVGTVSALDGTGVFTQVAVITPASSNVFTQYTVSFAGYSGNDQYICFQHGVTTTYQSFYLDNVILETWMANDLAAVSITGVGLGTSSTLQSYNITVKNNGSNTQNSYTVNLMSQGTPPTLLNSIVVNTPIASYATAMHTITWMPTTAATLNLFGQVLLTSDQFTANNNTADFPVHIYPSGTNITQIGNPNSTTNTNSYPIDLYWKNSLCETVYLAAEMQVTSGTINTIIFQNNFTQDLTKPIKIWMKNTTEANVANSFLPFDTYTLVFNGNVHFPVGMNLVLIPLSTPFNYTGGNLAVRTYRVWEDVYWEFSNVFYYTPSSEFPNRTRYFSADQTAAFNPVSLLDYLGVPFTGTVVSNIPNTCFIIQSALNPPVVSIANVGTNAVLTWPAVSGANSYKVYASNDPFNFVGAPVAIVFTNSYTVAGVARKFFKVVSSTSLSTNMEVFLDSSVIRWDNSKIIPEPAIGKTGSKE